MRPLPGNNKRAQRLIILSLWLLLLSVAMSLHFILIQGWLRSSGLAVSYAPVAAQHADPAFNYLAILRKLLSGLYPWGDQFVREVHASVSIWPRLPYVFLSAFAWSLRDNLDAFPMVASAITLPLNAVFLYVIVGQLSAVRWMAVIAATGVLGFSEFFVLQPWHFLDLSEMSARWGEAIWFNRLVNPQVSFLVLCVGVIALYRLSFAEPKSRDGNDRVVVKWSVFLGFVYGISYYTYLYVWSYLSVILSGTLFYLLWKEKVSARVKRVALALAIGIGLSAFYWIDVFRFQSVDGFAAFSDRFRLGRQPDIAERLANIRPQVYTLFLAGICLWKRRPPHVFLLGILVAAEVLWKVPLVIGYDFQTLHYAYLVYGPLALIGTLVSTCELVRFAALRMKLEQMPSWAVGTLALLAVGLVASRSIVHATRVLPAYAIQPEVIAAYEYVQKQVSPGAVILAADPEVNMRLRYWAPVYVYTPSGWGTVVTTENMLTRAVEALHAYGVEPKRTFGRHGELLSSENYLFALSTAYPTRDSRRTAIQGAYDTNLTGTLSYQADILWFGPYERALAQASLDVREGLELIFRNDSVSLYKISSRDALSW